MCSLNNTTPEGDVKDKIVALLQEGGFEKERPQKLDIDDFLRLLSAFNERGLHFC